MWRGVISDEGTSGLRWICMQASVVSGGNTGKCPERLRGVIATIALSSAQGGMDRIHLTIQEKAEKYAMSAPMKPSIDDTRIREIKELTPPAHVLREFPATPRAAETAFEARQAMHRILYGADDRLLVVIGPCSIHDTDAALDYARRLKSEADRLSEDLLVVMRVYFEKPRTTVGWKGLINDPGLDNSFRINDGLRIARKVLWEINELGMPAATEFLDMITPQYVADLIAWGAIGARTTESQVHRELASGLSCPVGFKN